MQCKPAMLFKCNCSFSVDGLQVSTSKCQCLAVFSVQFSYGSGVKAVLKSVRA